MSRPRVAALALAIALVPAGARADDERAGRARVALRTGAALPLGDLFVESGALGTTVAAMVPVRLDLGYRLSRAWTLGAQATLGALLPAGCAEAARCAGMDVRAGATLAYDFAPSAAVAGWIAVGAGFEWLSWTRSVGARRAQLSASGPELFELQGGIDLRPSARVRLGPVLSASLGRFDSITLDGATTRDYAALVHSWVAVSLRAAYDLGP